MSLKLISIVSPVYGAEGIIAELVSRISASMSLMEGVDYEIILVEDSSPDNSWEEMMDIAKKDKRIKAIKLSRNFGQHNAIAAGMEICKGDFVVLMDCDLQHNPKYIPKMYDALQEKKVDLIYAKSKTREHNFFKNIVSKLFYKFLKLISGYELDPYIGNFSILSRKVVEAYNNYNDYQKSYLYALKWVGFEHDIVEIDHESRYSGESSYSLSKLLTLALNIAISNSNKLLYMTFYVGLIISLIAFIGGIATITNYFINNVLLGWTSIVVSLMFFSGLIISTIGIVALYIAKIYEQTKNRPRYIISKKINLND